MLKCLDIEQLRQNPTKCSCSSSPFNFIPACYIIMGDVNIVQTHRIEGGGRGRKIQLFWFGFFYKYMYIDCLTCQMKPKENKKKKKTFL
jgi:hypothetical protein